MAGEKASRVRSSSGDQGFSPLIARTQTAHVPLNPIAFDCVKIIVVRSGSAILLCELGERHVKVGDVVVLAANTLCGAEPEGWVTTTTLYLDHDYVVDQVFWQYAAQFADRLDAQRFLDTYYAEPMQLLRIGETRAGVLMPWLDELATLSIDGPEPRHFYRAQSLLFAILDVTTPYMRVTDQRVNIQRVCFERSTRWPLVIRALAGGVECGSSGGRG